MAKNKKKNNNIFSTALYYLNPANLSAEIKSYGYALLNHILFDCRQPIQADAFQQTKRDIGILMLFS